MPIKRYYQIALLLMDWMFLDIVPASADEEQLLKNMEARLPFISTSDVLYRRTPHDITLDQKKVEDACKTLLENGSPDCCGQNPVGLLRPFRPFRPLIRHQGIASAAHDNTYFNRWPSKWSGRTFMTFLSKNAKGNGIRD